MSYEEDMTKGTPVNPHLQDCLTALRERACTSHAQAAEVATAAAEHTIKTAFALSAAKTLCDVPTWSDFLTEAGISQDVARELLELHRVTLDARAVVNLGGVKAASTWATGLQLPEEGEVLAVSNGQWSSERPTPISYVWPVGGGHCAGILNFYDPIFQGQMTRTPATSEGVVWQCVWSLLGPCHAEMAFHNIAGQDAEVLVEALEARRIAAFGNTASH